MIFEDLVRKFLKLFPSRNEREIRRLMPKVKAIAAREADLAAKTDAELRAETDRLKARLAAGETLDDILVDAFALVREAAKRRIGLRHYDVQMVGGMVLHMGRIAEMTTGEGKTLVATCPAFLNALSGKGVHVITVNDYLASRDRQWMGPVYESLGLSVGVIRSDMGNFERREAYAADITYGTNNEFGFDYLRDNMKGTLEEQVQRRNFAIIDEVDNILIDEARTPLIISGQAEGDIMKYYKADAVARKLVKGEHFEVKEKEHQALLTEEGIVRAQQIVGVESFYSGPHMEWPHLLEQALRAHHLYTKDDEYVVQDGEEGREVVIVDEFTGRFMHGRRWSDGLHQAVEAKEGIQIRAESQTLATITFQNFFKLYAKLAGMTGTAVTEAGEFLKIYNLDVTVIPTNKPMVRVDAEDKVYATEDAKFTAIVQDILERHGEGRPVLVGTTSIEKSEKLSHVLSRKGIRHEVLNAKQHAREAEIVAMAGQEGHVTIATNMAGRGTDIKLGKGIADKGGLHIIGTERHEARRIDNQLRGRSGRQGDPGSSRFYLSLEDVLMRRFAGPKVTQMLASLGLKDDEAIEHRWVTRSVERAQKKVEERNFDIRKRLLEFDEVMNEQRTLVYDYRQRILRGEDLRGLVDTMWDETVDIVVDRAADEKGILGEEGMKDVRDWVRRKSGAELADVPKTAPDAKKAVLAAVKAAYDAKEARYGEMMRAIEKYLLLDAFDSKWKDHLYNMDALRGGIGLRSYASEDPKIAYKKEGYSLFEEMLRSIQDQVTDYVLRLEIARPETELAPENHYEGAREVKPQAAPALEEPAASPTRIAAAAQDPAADSAPKEPERPFKRDLAKVGRNDDCPCGSGQKFKKCHGAGAEPRS